MSLLDRVKLVPSEKLVICGIEKNGITQLIKVACALQGKPFSYWKCTQKPKSTAELISYLEDPDWNKVVVTRDPVERFISGYNSKCLMGDVDGKQHCEQALHLRTSDKSIHNAALATYNEFPINPHWRPQHHFCGGTVGTHYQHYTRLSMKDLSGQLEAFLRSAVSPAAFRRAMAVIKQPTGGHRTNAHEKVKLLDSGTTQLIKAVYKCDYELFQTHGTNQPVHQESQVNSKPQINSELNAGQNVRTRVIAYSFKPQQHEVEELDRGLASGLVEGLLANAQLLEKNFAGWHMYVYYDHTAPQQPLQEALAISKMVHTILVNSTVSNPDWLAVVPLGDPSVERFIVRSLSSRLSARDKTAVDAWVDSGRLFHTVSRACTRVWAGGQLSCLFVGKGSSSAYQAHNQR